MNYSVEQQQYKVTLEEPVVIPARTDVLVAGILPGRHLEGATALLSEDPAISDRYKLYVARILTVLEQQRVQVRIQNPTTLDAFLHAGTTVASATVYSDHLVVKAVRERGESGLHNYPAGLKLHEADLKEDQTDKLQLLISCYSDIFRKDSRDLGRTSLVEHRINTGDHPPIAQRPHRVSPQRREMIEQHVEALKSDGLIRRSDSSWAAPVVLAPKKDGTVTTTRFCVDYMELNAITKRDVQALPRIDDAMDALTNAKYFSSMDLASGYHQIPMAP